MRVLNTMNLLLLALILGLNVNTVYAEQYGKEVMLHGAIETTKISGYRGTSFELQDNDKDHAIFGFSSWERRDNPCVIMVRSENINDSEDDTGGEVKNLCGGPAKSRKLSVEYSDRGINEQRIFVSGVRVCMNKKGTRVKGMQLRGKKITDDGKVVELTPDLIVDAAEHWPIIYDIYDPSQPEDTRANCHEDEWQKWAECPRSNQIATGAVVHFEAGVQPRSLTGIALQCRHVGLSYVPAGDKK